MKVLTFTPHGEIPDFRGFSVSIVAQSFPLYFSGVEHLHVCDAEKSPVGLDNDETYGPVHRIHESDLYRRVFQKWTRLDPNPICRRMAVIANEFKPDIIHVHQLEFPVNRFKRWLKHPAKIVVHAHTLRDFDVEFGMADMYVAVSQVVRERLISTGAPKERVVVVHNGMDTTKFKPTTPQEKSALREKHNIPQAAKVVLFFGRKEEQKGFDLYLEAIADCADRHADLLAIAVGPTLPNAKRNVSYPRCNEMRRELSGRGTLSDLEPVTHQALAELIRLSDVAVLPSRQEPQGMAMIEAMACGLVVIAGGVEGILESIQHGVNGLLIDPFYPTNQATQELNDVLEHQDQYRGLRLEAAKSAISGFSWESRAALMQKQYIDLLGVKP